ncbi:MAG: GYD domain-containing protein [Roseiarcus sp.]
MPKYLAQVRYSAEGAKGLAREGGSSRRETIAKMAEAAGGRLEAFYFALGDVDAYVIMNIPDEATALAISLAVNASGAAETRLVKLITPEQMDAAAKVAVNYRPPGG